jgi:hypothetical protein
MWAASKIALAVPSFHRLVAAPDTFAGRLKLAHVSSFRRPERFCRWPVEEDQGTAAAGFSDFDFE